jgi:hypothetical protein
MSVPAQIFNNREFICSYTEKAPKHLSIWEAFQGKIFLINKALMNSHCFSNTEVWMLALSNL